jgi:Zn-dependent protease/CBS domain-containing protein
MDTQLKLFRIWNIPIGLHPSWFIIFGLLTWSFASGYYPEAYPQLTSISHWGLALVTSLLFFVSVLAHELGHAYLALRNGIPVKNITLFIFGGVAQITQEPRTPGAEFRIAIAGPLVSLALALFFEATYLLDANIPLLAAPSEYLARINLILALFNMIPGFPLDGGRVLRAIVWKYTGNLQRATRIASFSGQIVAFGFIGFGVFSIFTGDFFNGLWLAFIGWFLQNAAASSYAQMNTQRTLEGVKVAQVMSRDLPLVSVVKTLDRIVEEDVLERGHSTFFVSGVGISEPKGMVTLAQITRVPRREWPYVTAATIMTPMDHLLQIGPDTDLLDAIQQMEQARVTYVPVVRDRHVEGVLTQQQILEYLRLRTAVGTQP